MDVYIHIFLTSVLTGGKWSASRPGSFISGEIAPGTLWIGVWVDPIADLDYVEKRKFLTLPGLNSDPSVVQHLACCYTDCAITARNHQRVVCTNAKRVMINVTVFPGLYLRRTSNDNLSSE
jgi:hypothetical protein